MKCFAPACALLLAGCGALPWQSDAVSEPACTQSCEAHFAQCPQIFAGFPDRASVECPAEHSNCLRACRASKSPAAAVVPKPAVAAAIRGAPPAASATAATPASKESKLRELKRLYELGLITDDVYRDRQRIILSEP